MCCLFGLIDYKNTLTAKQKKRIIKELSIASEARGTDATGIAYNANGRLHIFKRPQEAHKLYLHIPSDARVVMGHTRMSTQGSEKKNYNNHPFLGTIENEKFALAHNGVLYNDFSLQCREHLPHTKIETDSYVAVQLLEQRQSLQPEALQQMAELVEGTFVFTVLDEKNQLTFIKGDNPICIYHFPTIGIYLYASTEEILRTAAKHFGYGLGRYETISMDCGDILQIDANGKQHRHTFDITHLLYGTRRMGWSMFHSPVITPEDEDAESEYIDALKITAAAYGYTAEEIDYLLAGGFMPEEIESFLYDGRFYK